ncbi:MAG: ribokinase [Pirellulales bacterium]|nr:ribokinase [Pirellulales bacterium]
MMSPAVIVVGSINTDLILKLPSLPGQGETVLQGEFLQAAGGKGANQAVAAARAGRAPVVFLAAVGEDEFGRQRLRELQAEGLVTEYIKIVAGPPSGIAMIFVDHEGENLIGVASGANMRLLPEDVDRLPEEIFEQARVFLASMEVPWETIHRGLQRAKAAGLLTILNPAPASKEVASRSMLELVDVLTPNTVELWQLVEEGATQCPEDSDGSDAHSWQAEAVHRLRSLGLKDCVVTCGAAGCRVFCGEGCTPLPALPGVRAVDTTAAGDAFNGCLAVALAEGQSLLEAARFATAGAGLSVTRPAAQPSLPRRAEIEHALRAWRGGA